MSEQPMIEEKIPKDERYFCFTKKEFKKDFDEIIKKHYTPIEELLRSVYYDVYQTNKHPSYDFIKPGFTYEELLEAYQKVKFIQIYDIEKPYKYSGEEIEINNEKYRISAYDIVGKEISEMQEENEEEKQKESKSIKPEEYKKPKLHIYVLNEIKSVTFFKTVLEKDQFFSLTSIFALEKFIKSETDAGEIINKEKIASYLAFDSRRTKRESPVDDIPKSKAYNTIFGSGRVPEDKIYNDNKAAVFKTFFHEYKSFYVDDTIRRDTLFDVIEIYYLYNSIYDQNKIEINFTMESYHYNYVKVHKEIVRLNDTIKELFRLALRVTYINRMLSPSELVVLEKQYNSL